MAGTRSQSAQDRTVRARRATVPVWLQVLATVGVGLAVWEFLSRAELISARLFSSPTKVMQTFVQLLQDGQIWHHVGVTVKELLLATALFVVVGGLLGILLGVNRLAFEVTYGPITTLFAFPKVTLFPVLIMAVGLGTTSKVLFGALFGVFPLIMGVMVAVRGISPTYLMLLRATGASFWFRCSRLYIPATLPATVAALRIGFVYAGIGVLLAEMFAAVGGLGNRIIGAGYSTTLDQFWVYVGLTFAVLLGGAGLLQLLEMRLRRWSQ